jgi:hypothetical protein
MTEAVSRTAEAVLVAHQRLDIKGCLCGWSELGKSHAAHQVRKLAEAGALADAEPGALRDRLDTNPRIRLSDPAPTHEEVQFR